MRDTADDLANILAAGGLSLTKGTNLFLGPMPDSPDKCVAVIQSGGPPPSGRIGGGKEADLYVRCQVHIRGLAEDFQEGQALAFAVLEALNQVDSTYYVAIRARESSPFYGGSDDAHRHQWSFNVECHYVNSP